MSTTIEGNAWLEEEIDRLRQEISEANCIKGDRACSMPNQCYRHRAEKAEADLDIARFRIQEIVIKLRQLEAKLAHEKDEHRVTAGWGRGAVDELARIKKLLIRCVAAAGNPDPAEGCRIVIQIVEERLK